MNFHIRGRFNVLCQMFSIEKPKSPELLIEEKFCCGGAGVFQSKDRDLSSLLKRAFLYLGTSQ